MEGYEDMAAPVRAAACEGLLPNQEVTEVTPKTLPTKSDGA